MMQTIAQQKNSRKFWVKIVALILLLIFPFILVGCDDDSSSGDDYDPGDESETTMEIEDVVSHVIGVYIDTANDAEKNEIILQVIEELSVEILSKLAIVYGEPTLNGMATGMIPSEFNLLTTYSTATYSADYLPAGLLPVTTPYGDILGIVNPLQTPPVYMGVPDVAKVGATTIGTRGDMANWTTAYRATGHDVAAYVNAKKRALMAAVVGILKGENIDAPDFPSVKFDAVDESIMLSAVAPLWRSGFFGFELHKIEQYILDKVIGTALVQGDKTTFGILDNFTGNIIYRVNDGTARNYIFNVQRDDSIATAQARPNNKIYPSTGTYNEANLPSSFPRAYCKIVHDIFADLNERVSSERLLLGASKLTDVIPHLEQVVVENKDFAQYTDDEGFNLTAPGGKNVHFVSIAFGFNADMPSKVTSGGLVFSFDGVQEVFEFGYEWISVNAAKNDKQTGMPQVSDYEEDIGGSLFIVDMSPLQEISAYNPLGGGLTYQFVTTSLDPQGFSDYQLTYDAKRDDVPIPGNNFLVVKFSPQDVAKKINTESLLFAINGIAFGV